METLKEFRPESLKKATKTTRSRKKKGKAKKAGASAFSATNIALLVGVFLLGYGKYQGGLELKKQNQVISNMNEELAKLKMEKMKYMADKKIQAIANQTLDSKKSHIESLKAIVAKSKNDLTKVSNELAELKKVKMTELQYKTKLAQLEKDYQQRLDAHNLDSTRTIKKMGRKMMAEVDKVKTRGPASASSHVVNFNSFKKVNQKIKPTPSKVKPTYGDLPIGEWRDNSMEF